MTTSTSTAPAVRPRADGGGGSTRPVKHPGRRRRILTRATIIWGFLFPALLLFAYFKFIPMVAGIRMSFHDVRPFLGDLWVGWDNYVEVLTDAKFHSAIWHTVLLGVGGSVGALAGGLLLALLLEGSSKFLWLVRTAAFLPVVTATAVVAEVWRIIYYPAADGFLNSGLAMFGLEPIRYLEDPKTALLAVMVVGIWQGAPYNMVIFLAGLASVDRSLYEAAAIDGAGVFQRLRHIVIPALRPALTIVLVLAAIRSLRVFTDVWVLTGGGPSGATEVWMTRTYSLGFERNEVGIASAASIVLLVVTVIITLVTAAALQRRKDA